MKKEIPVLYSTPMVQAVIDDRKTMTRRTKGLEFINESFMEWEYLGVSGAGHLMRNEHGATNEVKCPYGKPGDLLWVRETWRGIEQDYGEPRYEYKATEKIDLISKWNPSIHMPKSAARIWLEVTDVRVERLQDISVDDAAKEGVEYWNVDAEAFEGGELVADYKNYMWKDDENYEDYNFPTYSNPVLSFASLWKSIDNDPKKPETHWEANPWVWVVSFKVLSKWGKPLLINRSFTDRNTLETTYY